MWHGDHCGKSSTVRYVSPSVLNHKSLTPVEITSRDQAPSAASCRATGLEQGREGPRDGLVRPLAGQPAWNKAGKVREMAHVALALHHVMQASLGARPGPRFTAPSVPATMQEWSIRPRLEIPPSASLSLPSGVVIPQPPPPGFPAGFSLPPLVARRCRECLLLCRHPRHRNVR